MYVSGHVGAGSNAAIAAAASRAIGATLEMQQGRRTASLKASYEAVQRQSAFAAAASSYPQQQVCAIYDRDAIFPNYCVSYLALAGQLGHQERNTT